MGIRVHPAESLAAFYPWLAAEWAPGRNALRPDQVSRASAREIVWCCPVGHEWSTPVYQRTLSGSGCPDCYRAEAAARSTEGKARARATREAAARARIIELPRRVSGDGPDLPGASVIGDTADRPTASDSQPDKTGGGRGERHCPATTDLPVTMRLAEPPEPCDWLHGA